MPSSLGGSVLATGDRGFGIEPVRRVARRHEDQKLIETWSVRASGAALDGLLADVYPPNRGGIRLIDRHGARSGTRGRDHVQINQNSEGHQV